MDDFTRQACEIALRKMFQADGHLSICTVDQVLKAANVVPPKGEYDAIRLLHCVSWRDMPTPVRDEAVRRLLSWFALDSFDPFAVPVSEAARQGVIGRLLGRPH